ncbi:family 20 glycosylhydrolase [Microbacterium sp. NPDC089698]|uniref:family 20 glycosylhydrolase n=1 Tax=Microbacterium sp. NPDC089698 TaxID=3364200 RepID=UPI0037F61518
MIESLPIIPRPADLSVNRGELAIDAISCITFNHPSAFTVATRFRDDLQRWAGIDLSRPSATPNSEIGVRIELQSEGDRTGLSPESVSADGAYALTIDGSGVLVTSDSAEGLHRGLTTIVQLFATLGRTIPHLQVVDAARYGWRGLSLDTARSFVPVDEIRSIIDVLSLYKVNVLHLHLSDNEGWRLEMPGWPRLTGTGSSYYTASDLAELSRYAADRFITVIPEIDLPGHVGAAIRAYPELNRLAVSELDRPFPRANLDPASATAWRFVDDIVEALASVTAGPYLHVGGDEAFGMDDAAHVSFVERVLERTVACGKIPIGWQEISRARVQPGQLVQHWIDFSSSEEIDDPTDSTDTQPELATRMLPPDVLRELTLNFSKAAGDARNIEQKGVRVVLSPTGHAYLDRPHQDRSLDPGQRSEDFGMRLYPPTPLGAYLEWDPATVTPTIPADRIVGVEAALWTEHADTRGARAALLLPRLPAVAEVAWSSGVSSWEEYRARLARHSLMWQRADISWYQADSVPWQYQETVPR